MLQRRLFSVVTALALAAGGGFAVAEESSAAARPVALDSTVLVHGKDGLQAAPQRVRRCAEAGATAVNFTLTMHARVDEDRRVTAYGLVRGGQFEAAGEPIRQEIETDLAAAFKTAVEHDLDIAILPHLDADGEGGWRNFFDFDPLAPIGGATYEEFLIDTAADALAQSAGSKTRVEFNLAGEMGRTVFLHAESYRQVARRLRERLPLGDRLKIGVSLNWNNVAGECRPDDEQKKALQQLLDECDFVGISCYHPVSVPPAAGDFAAAIDDFAKELGNAGVHLPPQTRVQLSEVGLGGVGDAARAAREPYNGTSQIAENPWAKPELRQLRVAYHRALLDYLRRQPGPRPIASAYLWNTGSWDPQGIESPEFADSEIIELVRQHNRAVRTGAAAGE